MKLNRRRAILAGIGTLAAVAGCSKPQGAQQQDRHALVVGLTYIPNIQFSPFYVGVGEGIFEGLGLDVTLRHHGVQEDIFGALLRGSEQVVFASSDEAVVASLKAPELRTFATAYQTYPAVIIAAKDSGIKGVPDLRGKVVGLPGHFGSNYYGILAALHGAGLDEGDVTLQDIGFTQVSALTTGKVDAVVGFANNDSVQFAHAGFATVEIPVQDEAAPTLVGPGLITRNQTVPAEVLKALADGMKEAEERIVADPELAVRATLEHVPALADAKEQESARAVLGATSKLWLRDGKVSVAVDPEAFGRMGAFLVKVGVLDDAPGESVLAV